MFILRVVGQGQGQGGRMAALAGASVECLGCVETLAGVCGYCLLLSVSFAVRVENSEAGHGTDKVLKVVAGK